MKYVGLADHHKTFCIATFFVAWWWQSWQVRTEHSAFAEKCICDICHFVDTSTIFNWHQKHTKSRLFDTRKTQNSWFSHQNTLIHIFWHQPANFDTSAAGGAGDKYEVCRRNGSKFCLVYTEFWILGQNLLLEGGGGATEYLLLTRAFATFIYTGLWCPALIRNIESFPV